MNVRDNIRSRINLIIDMLGLSKRQFAFLIDKKAQDLNYYLNSDSANLDPFAQHIESSLGVTSQYILTGSGIFFADNPQGRELKIKIMHDEKLRNYYNRHFAQNLQPQKKDVDYNKLILPDNYFKKVKEFQEVKMIDSQNRTLDETFKIPKGVFNMLNDIFAFEIKDNSMCPLIKANSTLIFKKLEQSEKAKSNVDNNICIVEYNNTLHVRRIKVNDKTIVAVAQDPNYDIVILDSLNQIHGILDYIVYKLGDLKHD